MAISQEYNHQFIEEKWQSLWREENTYKAENFNTKPKYYLLEMLPYPSGNIHMGHVRNYSIGDVVARHKRMQGFNVLHPMGWDAFGLPAENAAIKNATHPAAWTYSNIDTMRTQLKRLGYSYDWEREIATCHPDYYKWEQLFFIRLLEKGLAYRKNAMQNWCPQCNTVLANEQVVDGLCWRCDSHAEQKAMTQWFLRITDYAEELLNDLTLLEKGWPERVISMQRNWIGKSIGAEADFILENSDVKVPVFTTRPDTLFGVTFLTLAPEHQLVQDLIKDVPNKAEIESFIDKVVSMDKNDRQSDSLEKEGIFTGKYAIHPLTKEKIPLWLGNFVLAEYGTGAVMGVPAHDKRDFLFAKKFGLPITVVISQKDMTINPDELTDAYTEDGILVNSDAEFNGLDNISAKEKITEKLQSLGLGKKTINYRLRDWNISRQRYWGTPIPVVYCDECGIVPVDEKDLPVLLPLDVQISPDGRSPLPTTESFINTPCPKCGKAAKRETDTMDTFMESSWYFTRYVDPRNEKDAVDKKVASYWLPVDQYIGGVEHAILHLLYARFFTKVLRDLGFYPPELAEPFSKLLTQGMVLKDGYKMSKSKGNVVDPTEMIQLYGADTVRLFCLFAAPPERDFDWSETGIEGASRFLNRVWRLCSELSTVIKPALPASFSNANSKEAKELRFKEHSTIKKVQEDIENKFQFNTAIAAIMEFVNTIYSVKDTLVQNEEGKEALSSAMATLLSLLSPFTPHITEEVWQQLGNMTELCDMSYPTYSEDALQKDVITLVVQINGKLRGKLELPANTDPKEAEKLALEDANIIKHLENMAVVKVIVVPQKLINIVVKPK